MPEQTEPRPPGQAAAVPAAPVGAIPSPNIWSAPDVYEIENRAVDRDGAIWAAMSRHADLSGAVVLDVGCGSGFHLPVLAERAARVIGVEPHPPLLERARRRVAEAGLSQVQVLAGTAQDLPLPDDAVDVVHARWAYFFGPGCEPGLAELERVVRPGGTAFVIDNDARRSTFGGWFRRAFPDYDPAAIERFWTRHGWTRDEVDISWQLASRADLEAVIGIEFAPALAAQLIAEHDGLTVDYAVNLWHRSYR